MATRRRATKKLKKNHDTTSGGIKKDHKSLQKDPARDESRSIVEDSTILSSFSWKVGLVFVALLIALIVGCNFNNSNTKVRNKAINAGPKSQSSKADTTISSTNHNKENDRPDYSSDSKPHINDTLLLGEEAYKVLEVLNHDKKAFTQGLTWFNGYLYEGTGLHGLSQVRKLDPSNPSNAIATHSMSSKFFGEGITYYRDKDGNDKIIQITWQEKTAFVYDANTFQVIQEFQYSTTTGEGWGITYIESTCEFVVSDGSHHLIFWDCESFTEKRRITVNYYKKGTPSAINLLNELEVMRIDNDRYVILANVWYQDVILQIDPSNGDVEKIYYFETLHETNKEQGEDVFNGISICDESDRIIYLTGKLWSKIYKVELLH